MSQDGQQLGIPPGHIVQESLDIFDYMDKIEIFPSATEKYFESHRCNSTPIAVLNSSEKLPALLQDLASFGLRKNSCGPTAPKKP